MKLSIVDNSDSGQTPYFTVIGLLESDPANWYYLDADGNAKITAKDQTLADLAVGLDVVNGATLPNFISGRIYVSFGSPLASAKFASSSALVLPSENTNTDPNYYTIFDKVEFTNVSAMCSCNTTLVDGFGAPLDLTLTGTQKGTQNMGVLTATRAGMFMAFSALPAAFSAQVVSKTVGKTVTNVRAISPALGVSTVSGFGPQFPANFMDTYIKHCWNYFTKPGNKITIDMQAAYGTTATGFVTDGRFNFSDTLGNSYSIKYPTTAQVLGCNGPFLPTGSGLYQQMDGIIKRTVGAALNRGVLTHLHRCDPTSFYIGAESNKYAQVVHANSQNSQNYAFPYDDVCGYSSSMGDTQPTLLALELQAWE